ncbi:glutathione-regulated potassium-efflux system protein KefC [soil metagenome]
MSHGFLYSALIFLACAVLFVPICQKLGLGSVLGYLLGGIAIGPWGFGLIANVEDIMQFSEFGIVLFLFLIGLELEPKRLWSLRVPIFGLGTLQVALNTIVFTGAGLLFGWAWQVSLLAGMGFALSSTAIALQVLKEKNTLQSKAGNSAFSILLFQDIVVIPMIAILPLLVINAGVVEQVGATAPKWIGLLKMAGIFVAIFFVGRLATRPVLRIVASTRLREIFTAFALLLIVGMSSLMQFLGLSMGLGAFIAGVLLADSEYRHALETDIEPFKGLLLGLFFISVGMSIDVGSVRESPMILAGMVAAIMSTKFAIHYGLGRAFGLGRGPTPHFSLVLAQVGEFAFVLFASAKAAGVLDDHTAASLVAATALSMLMSPLTLAAFDKWLAPMLGKVSKPEPDVIENSHPEVIIAGFGRFGQIIGRLLYANGIGATVLDHEPDQIELLRKFGFKIYYGDATREDLLHAAGARDAKILVVAIDNAEDSIKLVDLAQKEFPNLRIYSRARNVQHVYELIERKVEAFERETFEASLLLGRKVLQGLGWPAHPAWIAANTFRDHNSQILREMSTMRANQDDLVSYVKQSRADLEKMFEREKQRRQNAEAGWD